MTPSRSTGALSDAGREAAQAVFRDGPRNARFDEHREVAFAKAALNELAHLIDTATPGYYVEQAEGIEASVQNLHVEPERALAEIAQNADDCGATKLRFALRGGPRGRELICAHDGGPVTLRDAVGMTTAYISGKRDDPQSTGKFGIGLKTIAGMASSFAVHCSPYHFTVEKQHPVWSAPLRQIPGFWSAESGETLLILHLRDGYDDSAAVTWVRDWGTSSMLFLRKLRRIEFNQPAEDTSACQAVAVEDLPSLELEGLESPVEVRRVRDLAKPTRVWTRYLTRVAAPATLGRAHKQRTDSTPLGIAVSYDQIPAKLFAGLPLDEDCELPFSVHGQFDPDFNRAQIRRTAWNEFVVSQATRLANVVLLHLLANEPGSAWLAVPDVESRAGRSSWATGRFDALVEDIRSTVAAKAQLPYDGELVPLAEMTYEAPELEEILSRDDLIELGDGHAPLVKEHRDVGGRWRAVMADLACGHEIDPAEAAAIFDWDPARFGTRSPEWIASLIDAVVSRELPFGESPLDQHDCLLLPDSSRISPAKAAERGILARVGAAPSLARRLGIAVELDDAFVDSCQALEHASEWLKDTVELQDKPTGEQVLAALAARSTAEALTLTDPQLSALRDELSKLGPGRLEDLGPRVGERIMVRGYETLKGGKRHNLNVRPAGAYLPSRIDGHPLEGFRQAASRVAGLLWVNSSYAELLKTPRGSRKLAARPLLLALGAHGAPRLEPVAETRPLHNELAAPLKYPVPDSQEARIKELGAKGEWINGLRADHDSPDLVAVLEHIVKLRGQERSKAARALLLCINREWQAQYADRATADAMEGYGRWYRKGGIPATWRARIQSAPFLTNESGRKRSPMQLALRSSAYVAVLGEDRSAFCKEIRDGDLATDIAEALGFDPRPRARRIIDQLATLRDRTTAGQLQADDTARRADAAYLALAVYAREARSGSSTLSRRDQVDDLSVEQIRTKFASGDGLIFANGHWQRPRSVFRGAPIFGGRRPFVLPDARDLWDVLGIEEPSIGECIKVLHEVAAEAERPDDALLTSIYTHMEQQIASQPRTRALKTLPLWCGETWSTTRPVYAIDQEDLAASLAQQVAVWQAPCALSAVPKLTRGADVTVLDANTFVPQGIGPGNKAAGQRIRDHFVAAVRYLAELASKRFPEAHTTGRVTFDQLESFELAHSGKLEVVVPLGPGKRCVAETDVFASLSLGLIAFRDTEALGRYEAGGLAIASLFGDTWAGRVAPLWEIAWQRADPENLLEKIRLARQQPEDRDPLEQLMAGAAGRKSARALIDANASSDHRGDEAPNWKPQPGRNQVAPTRRLRDLSSLDLGEAGIIGEKGEGKQRHRETRPLVEPSAGMKGQRRKRREPPGIREFDEHEKETAGFKLLARALKSLDGTKLSDYRDLPNLGSDSIDEMRRYFELKAHEGDIPDEISLTSKEALRALKERGKFFLAVVGGLETGQVVIRIMADPLITLDSIASGPITLAGVTSKAAIEWRVTPPDEQDAAPAS